MTLPQNAPTPDGSATPMVGQPGVQAFFRPGDDCCPGYKNVRDLPRCQPYRELVEALWARYQPSQDPHFLPDARQHFLQRFWEMYLFVTLQEQGMNPQKGQALGPDFYLEIEGRRFWVEAVAPDAGQGEDRVPDLWDHPAGEAFGMDVPKREILLRYTNALAVKRDKWLGWLTRGVVEPTDGYLVAIDGRGCNDFLDGVIPMFIEAFLPFGHLTLLINTNTGKTEDRYFQHSDTVRKQNQAPVSTAPLLDESYAPVTAVLHSLVDCGNHPETLGGDFVVLHNPKASVRLPDSGFPWCLQQHFVDNHLESLRPPGFIEDVVVELQEGEP